MTIPSVGSGAPEFILKNQDNKEISLKDFKNKKNILLYFYPKALTPGCTTQACGMRDSESELAAHDTLVLGISPDSSAQLKKFQLKHALTFDLLCDSDHDVAESYGVWGPKKFMGREYVGILRTSFLIDKKGVIRYVMEKVNTKNHSQNVIAYIKECF